jgi:hypothetical protein
MNAPTLLRAWNDRFLPALLVISLVVVSCTGSTEPVNQPPIVDITSASPWIADVPVRFVATAYDPDGHIILYEWDWQNNGTFDYSSASSSVAQHRFTVGKHTARVRVTDNDGGYGTTTIALTIVESPSDGIYVSTAGKDYNDGNASAPVATLDAAYALARASGKKEILVEEGVYSEGPSFIAGVRVLGGRTLPTWAEGSGYSTFEPGSADDIADTTLIRRIEVRVPLPTPSWNSIALSSTRSNGALRFEKCRFISGNAMNGGDAEAAPPMRDIDGGDGQPGNSIFADGSSLGGNGGASPNCMGGWGGGQGQPSRSGACLGGLGGADGGDAVDGEDGQPGAAGTPGNPGVPASPDGQTILGWNPLGSTGGIFGQNGRGGGGGGGYDLQLGGGGGGGGGRGGWGAAGGTGGSGSFAVMLVASSPDFGECYFESGNGGNGGRGADGKAGGKGGKGGAGARMPAEMSTHRAGDGGTGGDGGGGGGGAGGPGGPSVCVFETAGSTPTITSPTFVVGSPGTGGAGGIGGSGVPAPAGATGFSGSIRALNNQTH